MSSASDLIEIARCRALLGGGCPGPAGPPGPPGADGAQGPQGIPGSGVPSYYGSFTSLTTQNAGLTPVVITFDQRDIGTIQLVGSAPSSQIRVNTTGVYKILFSAQIVSTGSNYIEIWPVVNGTSIPASNTRFKVPSNTEACLTVEYFLPLNANDTVQLYMRGDSTAIKIVTYPADGTTTPTIPAIPSIILTVMRIE